MKIETMRTLIFVLPLLSLLVASSIVRHQCARREHLKSELAQTEQEMARLLKRLPSHALPSAKEGNEPSRIVPHPHRGHGR
jgi:hypothetical protein